MSPSLSLLLNNLVRAIVPPSAALIYLPLRILAWHCSRIRPRPDEVSHETEPKQGPQAKKSHIFSLWVSHVTLRSCPPRGFLYITSHLTGIPLPWIREEFLRPDGRGVSTHVNMWADIKTQRSLSQASELRKAQRKTYAVIRTGLKRRRPASAGKAEPNAVLLSGALLRSSVGEAALRVWIAKLQENHHVNS